jgi:hypothetical protein
MIDFIKISDTEWRMTGSFEFWRTLPTKKVIIDGEEYQTRATRESAIYDIDKEYTERKSKSFNWITYEIDFVEWFGFEPMTVHLLDIDISIARNNLSTNNYIATLQALDNNGAFDKIGKICFGKTDSPYPQDRFMIILENYGFNNHVFIKPPFHVWLENSHRIPTYANCTTVHFSRFLGIENKIEIPKWTDIEKNEILIKYINRYATS